MKIALPASGENIATTFDFVDEIVVVACCDKKVVSKQRFILDDKFIPLRAAKLKLMKINTLICGAISNPAVTVLHHYDIAVVSGIAGEIDKVIKEFLKGNNDLSKFNLPGFSGNGCCRQKRRKRQQGRNKVLE
jgi:predicted Fe-Mo cluster-binding NifX family protein